MRRLLLATTILFATSAGAFAQSEQGTPLNKQVQNMQAQQGTNAPVFRSLTTEPGMVTTAPAAKPAAAPVATMAPSAPASASAAASGDAPVRQPMSRSGEPINSYGSGAIPALPLQATTENGVNYISGGISDEEKDQLATQEGAYNLRLQITGLSGEFVTDVAFALKDPKGVTLLTIGDAGPFVYMQVPSGSYHVEVTIPGKATKKVAVKVPTTGAAKSQIRI